MKAAVLIGAMCTWLICSGQAQAPADDLTTETLLKLNANKDFDASEALLLDFLKERPAAGKVVYRYLSDLNENEQQERVIALVSKLLPGFEEHAPEWSARLLHLRAVALLFGRYPKSHNSKDIGWAKNDLILAITYDENLTDAQFNLAMVYGIDGNVERAKEHLQRAIDTAAPSQTDYVKLVRGVVSMANERPAAFVEYAKQFYLRP
jgi:tetratricopeptide (TPR) repeat protein